MRVLLALLVLVYYFSSHAERSPVDPVALAAVLVNDARYERAQKILDQVDERSAEIDFVAFHRVSGLCDMGVEQFDDARAHFSAIVQQDAYVLPFLGQIELELGRPEQAIHWIDQIATVSSANTVLVKYRAHQMLNQEALALEALALGLRMIPENKKLVLQRLEFYLERQLVQVGLDSIQPFLSRDDATDEDFIHIARSFAKYKRVRLTEKVLQWGHLKHPFSEKVSLELSFFFVEHQRLFAAYQILSRLSLTTGDYNKEVAELARRLKSFDQALFYNSRIADQAEKFKQRLSIAIDMERYDIAVAMADKLDRLQLMQTDEIVYAMAFSHYRLGQYDDADLLLSRLTSNTFFEQAISLRKAMSECREAPALCL